MANMSSSQRTVLLDDIEHVQTVLAGINDPDAIGVFANSIFDGDPVKSVKVYINFGLAAQLPI